MAPWSRPWRRLLPLRDGRQAGRPSEESDAARSFLNVRLPWTKAPPEPVQPEHVSLLSGRSHAKSLWSRDVPERRDNLARFQRELFKMTFASSNPPDPASQFGLKPR